MKNYVFHGACTALITPFREGYINYCCFDKLLEQQLNAQIDAVVVCGTTGEAPTLTNDEKSELFRHTARYVNGRCKVIAGIGGNCTKVAADLARQACDTGVDALLSVTPYYNKCTQEGLITHYETIANSTSLPVIVYNVPSRTNVDIAPQTCKALSQQENIIGIKEANPDVAKVSRIRNLCGEDFQIFSGNDDRIVPFYAAGAEGVISVFGNLFPEQLKELTKLCEEGAYRKAAALQTKYLPLMDALFCEPNPIPVKAAMNLQGLDVGMCRLPLTALSAKHEARLKALLAEIEKT